MNAPLAPTRDPIVKLWPVILSYVLSFIYVGIYWDHQHQLFEAVEKIDGRVMWANLHLLYWISLFPFVNARLSENDFGAVPAALFGAALLMASFAWPILARALVACNGRDGALAAAIGRNRKDKVSTVLYGLAIALAFFDSWIACAFYAAVALIWPVPDRRMEKVVVS